MRTFWLSIGMALAGLALGSSPPETSKDNSRIPGFTLQGSREQRSVEDKMASMLDVSQTERHFRFLTEEPHPAGSERNRELAHYIRDRFVDYGLEDVEIHAYEVLLPFPREVSVKMIEPLEYEASLKEDGYPVDKDSYAGEVGITYMGMSASGDVTAPVIYAHSGNPEDYQWLESQGIDPAGKIALVRYSVPYSYRGFKAWEAERRGVLALLIYSDPMEDGYVKGEVFPHGPWGPESHIQRGAVTYDFIVPGDPLTPGWASVEGARRIPAEEARSIPGIPTVPMSWRDAQPILAQLDGPVVPYSWRGGLPITYHAGPGPAKVRVKVDMDGGKRTIYNVVGRIRGTDEPDKMVILGNHRDAWVYGGVDPSSGTATHLELARTLGQLARQGHRPRRTLVFADWDAEEVHLTGSTEWGEQFAESLSGGGIAYINVDSSTSGPNFMVNAVASMNPSILSVARDVIDPNSRRSLLEAWRKRSEREAGRNLAEVDLITNELGSGSDYTVFLNYLGIPIVDLTFDGPYGVYHSQYDNYYWMAHFGDPGFRYMTAMAEVWGRLALRWANAHAYPYDFSRYAATAEGFLDDLAEQDGVKDHLDLAAARAALESWSTQADKLQTAMTDALEGQEGPTERFNELNEALLLVERRFLLEAGIPDRPWFKHALYAPRYTYAAMSLPGVTEAAEARDWGLARGQLNLLVERIRAVTDQLAQTTALIP